VLELISL